MKTKLWGINRGVYPIFSISCIFYSSGDNCNNDDNASVRNELHNGFRSGFRNDYGGHRHRCKHRELGVLV